MARQRSMSAILEEIESVKAERREALRGLTAHIDEKIMEDPRRVRIETRKAENHESVIDLDERLRDLRAEQRAHDDFPAMQARWEEDEEANRGLHEERAKAIRAGKPIER